MREIKFRAWMDWRKEMMYDITVGMGLPANWSGKECLMQFTGFVHKGDDLYEGDILEEDCEWYEIGWDQDRGAWICYGRNGNQDDIELATLSATRNCISQAISTKTLTYFLDPRI